MITSATAENFPEHPLSPLLRPRSIAVLGASPRENTLGNNAVANLIRFGFEGGIYPVHPTAAEVAGLRAHANLASLPETPDCAVVALSADKVLPALEDAASRGVRAAVVFASGYAETGAEGLQRQQALQDMCKRTGMVICGPNCLGLVNVTQRTSLYSSSVPESVWAGGLAVVSHSGSGCIAISTLARFGISHLVSAGNAAVVDMAEYLEYLADEPSTRVVALFMETMRDPDRFAAGMQAMHRAGKPVIALKVGKSVKGAAASAAHTGSLAGSAEAYAAYFHDQGVIAVDDLDEMCESIALMLSLSRKPAVAGRPQSGLGIISVSGGETALLCDVADRVGVRMPELTPEAKGRLRSALPDFGTPSNPLDATGNAVYDTRVYEACMEALASDPNVALVAAAQDCSPGLSRLGSGNYRRIAEAVVNVASRIDKPVAFFNITSGGLHPLVREPLDAAGIPVMQGARASLLAFQRAFSRENRLAAMVTDRPGPGIAAQQEWRNRLATGRAFTEREAKQFLAAHGLPVTREQLAIDEDAALKAAAEIGYPVVIKIESPDIAHKTEAGGVRIGIADAMEMRRAFAQMVATVREREPSARIDGVLVQEMVTGGVEMLAGLSRQAPFGMAIVTGAGGVLVELVKDAAMALCPMDETRARNLVESTRAARLLAGFRGAAPADIAAFCTLLSRLSAIGAAYEGQLEAIDLNPVAVLPAGRGVRILDALVIPRTARS